tara:strand:+ start:458 stop:1954 length:1497 start_codon:yes stop_codon:yes gene_type:complete
MLHKKIYIYCNKLFGRFSVWPIVFIGLLLRLVNINAPVLGVHSWRQADTASIARNFLSNNFIFWQPQVNWSGSTEGFVECEFPLYQYLVAHLYKIFGFNEIFARSLSVIFGCLSIFFLFRLIKRVFDIEVAWWGSFFYSILPVCVFYSRTIQPESLMMFLGIFSLERWLVFLDYKNKKNLILSWIAFTLAVLIKVLPLFWIGIPILITGFKNSLFIKYKLYIFPILTILLCLFWYVHSYKLGQSTGLSFGLWGSDTDRYSWSILLELRYYIDLILRILLRNFLLIGFLLIVLGIKELGINNIFFIGICSVLFTGFISPISFGIHEYYQLPIMIFSCPLMGFGFVRLKNKFIINKFLMNLFISILCFSSLMILKFDYWDYENPQIQPVWDTAALVKNNTNSSDLVISVTGGDPTLLYLSDRNGWLISPENINERIILDLKNEGAKYITGSWKVIESYNNFSDVKLKEDLRNSFCNRSLFVQDSNKSCDNIYNSYLVKLD